ncbi:MAG TPA: FixH family protein, partial [Gemmatimonadaceae bacterium]
MKPGAAWPYGIAAVLTLTVAANVALYYVAGRDPSFAIEPNYYAKALAWDSTLAQARRNQAFGWRVTPALAAFSRESGGARLSITVTDSAGTPIAGAVVRVYALYNARAGTVLESALRSDRDGYSTHLAVTHSGQWELRFDVT